MTELEGSIRDGEPRTSEHEVPVKITEDSLYSIAETMWASSKMLIGYIKQKDKYREGTAGR